MNTNRLRRVWYKEILLFFLVVLVAQGVVAQSEWLGPTLDSKFFTLDEQGDTLHNWKKDFWIKLYDGEFKLSNNTLSPGIPFYQTGQYEIIGDTLVLTIEDKFSLSSHTGMYFPITYEVKSGELFDTSGVEQARFLIHRVSENTVYLSTLNKVLHRYSKNKEGEISKRRFDNGIDADATLMFSVAPQDYCWPGEYAIQRGVMRYEKRMARIQQRQQEQNGENQNN